MAQSNSSVVNLRSEDVQALKPWIDHKIKSVLGFGDDTIVAIVADALNKQKSRFEIQTLLQDMLEGSTENFLNDLYAEIPKIKDSKSNSKRKRDEDSQSHESDKKKIKESSDKDRHRDSDKSSRDRKDKERDRERERERDKDRERRHDKDDRDRHHRDDRHRSDRDHKSRKRSRSRSRSRDRKDRDHRKESSRKDEKPRKDESSKSSSHKNGSSHHQEEEKPTTTSPKMDQVKVPIKTITVGTSVGQSPFPESQPVVEAAPAPLIPVGDISSLLAELQASKQALQQQLEQQKQDVLQTALLKKKLEQRKLPEKPKEAKKEKEPEKKEEKERKKERESRKQKRESATASDRFIPPPLLLDEKGREVDAQGNVLQGKIEAVATLKANIKLSEEKAKKQKGKPEPVPEKDKKTQFIDPNLIIPKADRRRKAFSFGPSKRQELAKREEEEEKKPEKDEQTEATPMEVEKPVEKKVKRVKDEIPDVEWWDKFLLQTETYEDVDQEKFKLDDITIYVEHPIPVKPPSERLEVAPMPLFLTKKEQKKLRRRSRMDRMKEKQERVMLGLDAPPKPKVKISNLMRVLTAEATADPTLIEQEVRRQMAERIANHEARNQANKLSKEERREKKKEKLLSETKKGIQVAVFRINDLTDPKNKFKVDITIRDLQITGCVIYWKDYTVLIAEAGAKAMKQFKKLMLKRIDWTKSVEDEKKEKQEENADAEKKPSKAGNKCLLVWEGTLLKQNFENFRFESFPDEASIRKHLEHHWSEHLWDIAKNFKESESVL